MTLKACFCYSIGFYVHMKAGYMNYKYVLTGIPYSGKSTLGARAAERLSIPFFDTDIMVRDKIGEIRIMDPFLLSFQRRFHDEQCKAVIELASLSDSAIIATGAEVVLIPGCAEVLKSIGFIIHIKRKAEIIIQELKNSANSRLVLVNQNDGSILDFSKKSVESFLEDIPHYEAVADFTIDNNGSEDDGVNKLVALIQTIDKALVQGCNSD